jgi:hypothetical protein
MSHRIYGIPAVPLRGVSFNDPDGCVRIPMSSPEIFADESHLRSPSLVSGLLATCSSRDQGSKLLRWGAESADPLAARVCPCPLGFLT